MSAPVLPSASVSPATVFRCALAGAFGLVCMLLGGSAFVLGKGALLADFPASPAEAVASLAGGAAVLYWAIRRLRLVRAGGASAGQAERVK